ncbi:MAG: LamG-like jellyroll fold domain-containing protein [Thermoguttaceae bacterium]|jgi:hypothetical protein
MIKHLHVLCFSVAFLFVTLLTSTCFPQEDPNKGIVFTGNFSFSLQLPKGEIELPEFTAAAWVKTSAPQQSQGILGIGEPSQYFTFYLYKNAVRMLVENDRSKNQYAYALAPAPKEGVWTHYTGVYDGTTIRIYADGKLAGEKKSPTTLAADSFDGLDLLVGAATADGGRPFKGEMTDLALWNRALSDDEIDVIYRSGASSITADRVVCWNPNDLSEDGKTLTSNDGALNAEQRSFIANPLLNTVDSGYRGVWYYNQKLDNQYVYKYSGGLGTYPANHYPFSVYRPDVDKTFFCYGGFDPEEKTLWHEVGVFDHKTHKVSRPTLILDKKTSDAHDNPVIAVDEDGYIWIFSTSHGTSRPSFIHKSVSPYDVSKFELVEPTKLENGKRVPMTNFSYLQVRHVPQCGFVSYFTTYDRRLVADVDPDSKAQRIIALMTSENGIDWSAWTPIAAMEIGHYQNTGVYCDRDRKEPNGKPFVKIGSAFNYHPAVAKGNRGVGLNWRTNLYYIESIDFGKTWRTIEGDPLEIPLLNSDSPALVRNYEGEELNVYIVDLAYDAEGRPIVAYVTSKGFESGPEMGPRYFCVARWDGENWLYSTVCEVDNNYEYAMIYTEEAESGVLRLVGSFEDGPQAYNTGGEISQWISRDNGVTWSKEYQLTEKSEVNQCFPRRTIDASPEFYAFWAEGNGRKKSISTLRFSTKDGKVYALPRQMKEDWEEPILIRQAPKL